MYSVQSLSCVRLFVTPCTAAHQASLSIANSQSLFKLMSIELVRPSNHLILCRPLLLLPSIFPGIRVFSNESVLRIRWPKYWNFSFSICSSNEYSELIFFSIDWFDSLQSKGLSRVFSNTTVQKHQFFGLYLDGKHKGSFLLCSYSSRQFFEKCLQKRSPLWAMATEKPNEVQDFLCPW